MTNSDLAQQVKDLALEIGYADCGITTAEPFTEYAGIVRNNMQRFPEAAPHIQDRLKVEDPCVTTPWAQSIVVCIRSFGQYKLPPEPVGHIARGYLADRRHGRCTDSSMPKRLTEALKGMGMRVKRGGVPDRAAAVRAGVARIGRNGFAYSRNHGSWVNIEPWRVDAKLTPDEPTDDCPCPDGCTACRRACPTSAIVEPCGIRMDRCIAWLTYASPQPIDPELWLRMGPWIYGCDECQMACPMNRGKLTAEIEATWISDVVDALTPQALASMDQETYEEIVYPLFWYIPKDDLQRWNMNAQRAVDWLKQKETPNEAD